MASRPALSPHWVIAAVALAIGGGAALLTLGTAAMTKLYFEPTAAAHFEERVGRLLMPPALLAMGAFALATALLIATLVQPKPAVAWLSTLLSVAAVVVSITAVADHRRRLDPRPELTRELAGLDLGPDASVVLRTSQALPDFPEVRWVYRVPLARAGACARARAALEAWADPGSVREGTSYVCHLTARRGGRIVSLSAAPEGAPLTIPSSPSEVGDAPVHHVMVELYPRT